MLLLLERKPQHRTDAESRRCVILRHVAQGIGGCCRRQRVQWLLAISHVARLSQLGFSQGYR